MIKFVCLKKGMSSVYFYCGGILLINAALPVKKILEIIKWHLDLKQ